MAHSHAPQRPVSDRPLTLNPGPASRSRRQPGRRAVDPIEAPQPMQAAAGRSPTASRSASPNASPCASPDGVAPPLLSKLSFNELISTFADSVIAPLELKHDGLPPTPQWLARLPQEILLHILSILALIDVGDYCRLALVCRRLAFIVMTEDPIWRRVCESDQFGFAAMHFSWNRPAVWSQDEAATAEPQQQQHQVDEMADRRRLQWLFAARKIAAQATAGPDLRSWLTVYREQPRIRFNGCYISASTYLRSGLTGVTSSVSSLSGRRRDQHSDGGYASWTSPTYRVVYYYRYLRFFRDGSVLSLLTLSEPAHIVRLLTRGPVPDSSTLSKGLLVKGRWRLALPGSVRRSPGQPDDPDQTADPVNDESSNLFELQSQGDLLIETEGVDDRFIYRLDLSIKSTRGGPRRATHNKLVWNTYHSYNRLTHDWSQFWLVHDRPFYFSRVKSYGIYGE